MEFESLVALFLANVKKQDPASLTTLRNGEEVGSSLTHFELADRAKRLASWLVNNGFSGQRAMLVFPPGLEFVEAFMACMFANVIAVPVAPAPLTGDKHKVRRILSILRDCQPSLVLGVKQTIDKAPVFVSNHDDLAAITWFALDKDDSWLTLDCLDVTLPKGNDLAFLQYTSGSTNIPKGVMLSHQNVLHNLAHFDHGWGHESDSKLICWLPHFHDLGLLYGVLFPLYKGISGYLLPPASIMQKPARWLRAISTFGGTHSMGPNFVYDQCTDRISAEDCVGLDLSTWRMALNAAEPIRGETVRRFNEKFSAYGLSENTLTGGFGLAESTCRVAAQDWNTPVRSIHISTEAMNRNKLVIATAHEPANEFISCGPPALDTVIKVVDADTCIECQPDCIGEIWVQSDSVSSGYWMRPEENARTFGAHLVGDDSSKSRPYMRTGDLGFIDNGELFITGRIKDLIIVGGENYYPQDAEWAIEHAHPAFKPSCCAVFSIERDGEEKIVVVQELVRHFEKWSFDEMITAVRRSVGSTYELPVEVIVFIRPGTTSKTSSGKIQRAASKIAYNEGSLQVAHQWDRLTAAIETRTQQARPLIGDIESYLITRVAEITVLATSEIDVTRPFAEYGLHSIDATQISGELAARFGIEVEPTAFYDNPNIQQLVSHLTKLKHVTSTAKASPQAAFQEGDDTVVVVGLACRFPGAPDASAYWKLLSEGGNAITERVSADGSVRYGGFLDNITAFDNAFFSITPREAACLDPQQRIALETTWHAMEDAGIHAEALRGTNTGVFFGASSFDYGVLQLSEGLLDAYTCQGSVLAVLANRISYQLDLCGPSFIVDTACSSALTALHLAARSVRDGECDLAFTGAIHFLLTPDWDVALKKAGMLAKDGQCKTFDASADGYGRGEGCGVIVLKRYADAIRDGDRIYGAILGAGINQDGRSNGLTAPNGNAQEALMRKTLESAGVRPSDVSYVEAHGTGTPLGDPIECGSLKRVLSERETPCLIGSAKANIGHLEAASGIAGLIKVLLALHHQAIPKQINMQQINPLIKLGNVLAIPSEMTSWLRPTDGKRYAVASAFGFSGTNGCVVVGDVTHRNSSAPSSNASFPSSMPFVMTARNDAALCRMAKRYAEYFQNSAAEEWPHALFTSACRRSLQPARFAVNVESPSALVAHLATLASQPETNSQIHAQQARPKIAFVFSGQGIPLLGAGRALHKYSSVFRNALAQCDTVLESVLGQSLASILYDETAFDLKRPAWVQPIQFALQYALTEMFISYGVRPDIVLGHSLGEYAALVTAGALSLDDALRLVIARGEFSEKLAKPGTMAAIFNDEVTVTNAIISSGLNIDLAAINGKRHCVVAGEDDAIAAFCSYISAEGFGEYRKLPVERAYHSALIEPVIEPFTQLALECNFNAPRIAFISNVSGDTWPREQRLDAAYLGRHLRQPVRFADSLNALAKEQVTLAIEIGTKPVLCNIGQSNLGVKGTRWMAAIKYGSDDWSAFMECLTQVFVAGGNVTWSTLFDGNKMHAVPLPPYAFETTTHWFQQRPINSNKLQSGSAPASFSHSAATTSVPTQSATPTTQIEPTIDYVLTSILAQVIQSSADTIDKKSTFFELGVDSIGLVDFIQSVNKKYGTQFTSSEVFENYPSISLVAERLISLQTNQLDHTSPTTTKVDAPISTTTKLTAANPAMSFATMDAEIERTLTNMLAQVIQSSAEKIDARSTFFELGVDSISLVDFIQSVNKEYYTQFTASEIFESYPSITLLTEYLTSLKKNLLDPAMEPAEKTVEVETFAPMETKMATTDAAAANEIVTTLTDILAQVICSSAEKIDKSSTFFELGVDSISLVDFIQAVNNKYHTQFTASEIFESFPSVDLVAKHLTSLRLNLESVS